VSPARSTAASIVELALDRPPTLGGGRLVCVDGPAGSGKTTLAAAIAELVAGARVVHMDDLYAGWSGLEDVDLQLAGLLRPLGEGRAGTYQRYDWPTGRFAESVVVAPGPMLVLEGVGSGAADLADLVTVLVWVEAPHDVRMARGIERDGDAFAPHWEQWARDEAALFARERTRERADVVVDGTLPVD
jgi:uridine kinase